MRYTIIRRIWVWFQDGELRVSERDSGKEVPIEIYPTIVFECPKCGRPHFRYSKGKFEEKAVAWARDHEQLADIERLFNFSRKFAQSVVQGKPTLPTKLKPVAARVILRFCERHKIELTQEQRARLAAVALG
jgi:ssDNA-binding Zn-finger/Zn-ribbon topoisomerase 1